MKVLVVGANGQIGQHLVQLLTKRNDYIVRAMVRSSDQIEALEKLGAEAVIANLEGTVDEIAQAIEGSEAIVFTAGSGGKTGPDKTLLVDLDGAVKTIEAAEKTGIQRFVMVSALQAHHRENWNEAIRPYYVAKHYADRMLVASNLNYTIIRPGGLTNDPGTGKVEAAENLTRGFISREDVARTIAAVLKETHTFKKSFDLTSGEKEIESAIQSI